MIQFNRDQIIQLKCIDLEILLKCTILVKHFIRSVTVFEQKYHSKLTEISMLNMAAG